MRLRTATLLLLLLAPLTWAANDVVPQNCPGQQAGAQVVSLQGALEYDPESKGQWQPIELNQILCDGSRIHVSSYSRASVLLPDGVVIRIDEDTVLIFNRLDPDKPALMDLLKGFVHFISRTPKHLQINTPIANAGPEGTEFALSVNDSSASLWVYEGSVKFFNNQGSLSLKPGQGAQAFPGQAPKARIDIKPEDAVNWALYYPALLPYPDASMKVDDNIRTAIQNFRQGRILQAISRLNSLPPGQRTPYFYKVRGAMLLTVGRVELAQQDIREILKQNPKDAEALALQSVLALTQNRKEEAYDLAKRAIASNPKSASAFSALSYAEQGRFELEKALQEADKATQLAPHDAMVWARKAELELALGLTSDSESTVQQAKKLDAELERTQTIVGFSHLQQMDADDAKQAFDKALKLDSTSPIARLGLGLAKIRNGDLEEGRQDLEIAAILDPNNSLIRSYLGKAYYEEKRNPLAEDQFKLAKERDPKDPTPYFYDAIKKQTENKPIEALQDLQKSITLNENRATYRSKLALDSDLAARSASLSRIYNNLGFGQVALVEGWKSVNTDPTNYSAHRLLADSYGTRPSFEIARVSELLQSQLLQPINMTPVQPQLGEKNLLTLQGSGPSSLSFNEFNPVFTRNRFALQTSGLVGSNDTYSNEVVHSGLWRNLSYSIGQYHYESGGFRPNNDAHVNLVNGFIQAALTPNFSIQAEIRHKTSERGDIDLNADGTFDKNFRIGSDKTTYRAGMHYSLSENSNLIASLIHTDGQGSSIISDPNDFTNSPSPIKLPSFNINGDQGEIQHLFRSYNLSNISGFGFAQSTLSPIDFPQIKNSTSHANGYSYNHIHYPRDVDWTLGLSVDSLEKTENTPNFTPIRFNRINPKLGMLWRTSTGSTLRGALFRTSKRSLITNQTIEPTQVAGFNQFYDDDTLTDVWLYGVALDQKFNSHIYGGLEIVTRNLYTPKQIIDNNGNIIGNKRVWHEQNYRVYLNWNLTSRLASNLSFHLEEFEGDGRSTVAHFAPLSTTTYDGKAGLRFFDPSGFFCNLEAEYVNQRTNWPDGFELNPPLVKHNEFVLFNAGVGIRLPKRWGIVQLDIKNIFDRDFNFQSYSGRSPQTSNDDGGQPPPFIPGRTIFARFTLAL